MPHERRPYAEGAFKLGLSDTLRRCDGLPIDLPRLPVFLFDIGPERPDKIVAFVKLQSFGVTAIPAREIFNPIMTSFEPR